MEINDRVYGREEVKEKILIDLINSPELIRLKDVSQLGMPEEYFFKKGFSRYEHSLGVFILLRKLGADSMEQIAGLLHDVNHTSFSHVIDWVVGNPLKEDHQDRNYGKFIKKSSIPKILTKNGYAASDFYDLKKFSILEKRLPQLCADRVDYTLREMCVDGKEDTAKYLFSNLKVRDDQLVFVNKEAAQCFAREYNFLEKSCWGSNEARVRYILLAKTLKKSFEKGILSLGDLLEPEDKILKSLISSGEEEILTNLNLLKNGFTLIKDNEGLELKKKFRYIDPEFMDGDFYKRLSDVSEKYFTFIEGEKLQSKLFDRVKVVEK